MDEDIARQWMESLARTANARDLDAHMNLVSRRVQVFGLPGVDVVGYEAWLAQCRHDFATGALKRYAYDGVRVAVAMPGRIAFETRETVESADGTVTVMQTDIVIEREPDGAWRVVEEQVMPAGPLRREPP